MVGYFPSPGQVGSGKTPVGEAVIKYLILRADLVRGKECCALFQNGSFFPPLAGNTRGFFPYSLGEPGRNVGGKTPQKMWVPLKDWVPLEFLFLGVALMELPEISQLPFRCPCHILVPADTAALVSCDSTYAPVGLSNLGEAVCPVTSLLFQT